MVGLKKSRYTAFEARSQDDIVAAQRLRHLAFKGGDGLDADAFDDLCTHILVADRKSGNLVCCFRFLPLHSGSEIAKSYSAQYYS